MNRNITYRFVPGSALKAAKVAETAGAARYVWNRVLADTQEQYRLHCDTERFCEDTLIGMLFERPARPSLTFFSLSASGSRRYAHKRRGCKPCRSPRYATRSSARRTRGSGRSSMETPPQGAGSLGSRRAGAMTRSRSPRTCASASTRSPACAGCGSPRWAGACSADAVATRTRAPLRGAGVTRSRR